MIIAIAIHRACRVRIDDPTITASLSHQATQIQAISACKSHCPCRVGINDQPIDISPHQSADTSYIITTARDISCGVGVHDRPMALAHQPAGTAAAAANTNTSCGVRIINRPIIQPPQEPSHRSVPDHCPCCVRIGNCRGIILPCQESYRKYTCH